MPPDMRVRPLRPHEEEAPVGGGGRRRVHTGRGEQTLHGENSLKDNLGGRDHRCSDSFSCCPSPVGRRPLPRSCQSDICRVCPSNICRFKCTLPSFLPPFSAQFVAYLAKTNIIPLQNEEGRTALTPKNQVCVSVTGVSLRDLSYTSTTNKWTTYP